MKHRIRILNFLFFTTAIFFPFLIQSQTVTPLDLNGKWELRKAGSRERFEANVPGCVHLDLLKNNLIPDPFYRDNESRLQWIGESGWEYQRTFTITEAQLASRHIELVCKGLDTYANVYINDSLVIVADNMFKEWYGIIKRFIYPGVNRIRIQFPSIVEENRSRYSSLKYGLPGDTKVVCRKAAYQFGWDWGPTFITSGIWKPIYIRFWNYVNVLDVQYIQKQLTDSVAKMTAVFTLTSELDDTAQLQVEHKDVPIAEIRERVKKGINVLRLDFDIKKPIRWWPNGMGEPYLYTFKHRIRFASKVYGEDTRRIGLRTIELVQARDTIGRSFYFKINGIPIFMKGANYVPQDNFPSRVKDSAYIKLIQDVKEANMNMLRVWGGGIYEKDIFYDLCDENGILVWQDFMFANAMYPDSKQFRDNVATEAIQNIVRLRRHPSIAIWCGNNEIDEGWKNWGWQKKFNYSPQDSAEIAGNYRIIFQEILPQNVRRFDTLRQYIQTSPRFGWGRAESLKQGDSHYWGVWWGKEPFSAYCKKVGRFMSEYGFQGFPDLSSIKKFTSPEDRQLGSATMKAHQKHPVGYETIDEMMLRYYKKPRDFESYVYVSQVLQAEGIKTAIEAHRRAMPYCMGTLYWQLNDCWPVVSWSSRDYYGKKKALHYWVKKEYAPILVSPVVENGQVRVYVISDKPEKVNAVLALRAMDFNGKILFEKSQVVSIPPNTSSVCFDTIQASLLAGVDQNTVLFTTSLIHDGRTISSNIIYFSPISELKLPAPVIRKKVTEIKEGYIVRLSSDQLVKNVYLSSALRGEFTDNYFDMIPGETYEVRFLTKKKSQDTASKIMVKSLVDTY